MKRIILIIVFSFFFQFGSAQGPRGHNNPRVKRFKIAFITDKLDLTEEESQKFWPLYNKFDKANHQLFKKEKSEIREKIKSAGGINNISDKEAIEVLNKLKEIKYSHYKLKVDFYEDLKRILPANKILKLEIAEHGFKKKMFDKIQKRRKERRNNFQRQR